MAGMMGGAQQILAGGKTVLQTLFMIQKAMGAMGEQHNHWTVLEHPG